jgi:hypothetical protein
VALLVGFGLLVRDFWDLFSRSTQRLLTERLLLIAAVGYDALLSVSLAGLFAFGLMLVRTCRRRGRWRPWARAWQLCTSVLVALVLAEAGATAWGLYRARAEPRLPRTLPAAAGNALHLVVIGGSSALGYPYQPNVSIGQIVAWRLGRAVAPRHVELEILAGAGANLEEQCRALAQIKFRPDALIVYSGHNEFWTRYPWPRRARPPRHPLEWVRNHSPLCRLIQEAIDLNRVDAPPVPDQRSPAIDWPACDAAERATRLADFRDRLEQILAFCRRFSALPILVVPPANDDGWEPNRSVLPASAGDEERAAVAQTLEAAGAADDDTARAFYEALLRRWPVLAEAHFRLARLLAKRGQLDEARRHFRAARESDGFVMRCPEAFQQVYRDLASEDTVLVDGPRVLRAMNPYGMLDYNLFHDAHHPTFRAHVALAGAVVRGLHDRGALGWPREVAPDVDPAECAAHFAIDRSCWSRACQWAVSMHRSTAKERHDPAERLWWADRFEVAGRAMAAGVPPERTGIPGLGVDPEWSPPSGLP